jgi:hypothetical protein
MNTPFTHIGAMRILGAVAALMGASIVAYGEIAVDDRLDEAGELMLRGPDWRATLRKDTEDLVLGRDGQAVRIQPLGLSDTKPREVTAFDIARHENPARLEIRIAFTTDDGPVTCGLEFNEQCALRIVPGEGMHGVRVECPIAVGILPGTRLEDVLYLPQTFDGSEVVHVPSENWFAALLDGQAGMLVCAWPDGSQDFSLLRGDDSAAPGMAGFMATLDGKPIHLELMTALGIWHKEPLLPEYLERTVRVGWKPPFPATYKTQLPLRAETVVPRTFIFRHAPLDQYLPEVGRLAWPAWFEGQKPLLRLSKRIPPGGDAIIYPMDGADVTLMGFIRRTPLAGAIIQRGERKAIPKGPRGASNVGFIACGGTRVMRDTVFALGLQNREQEFLTEYADFLADYVAIVQQKNLAHLAFVDKAREDIRAWLAAPEQSAEARAYLERMMAQANRVEEGLRLKIAFRGEDSPEAHIAEAARCAERLKELLATPGTEAWPECDAILDTCNRLAWGQGETVGMRFSLLVREWAQEAALGCAHVPEAVGYAQSLRASIRDALNGVAPW